MIHSRLHGTLSPAVAALGGGHMLEMTVSWIRGVWALNHLIRLGSTWEVNLKFPQLHNEAGLDVDIGDSLPWLIQWLIQPVDYKSKWMSTAFFSPGLPSLSICFQEILKRILKTYSEFLFLCFFIQWFDSKIHLPTPHNWVTIALCEANQPIVEPCFLNLLYVTLERSCYSWGTWSSERESGTKSPEPM